MDLLEAIKQDIKITEYAQAKGFSVVRMGNEYSIKEHDSVRIDPEKNLFIRNSDKSVKGSIIDFVMWVDKMDQGQAIRHLRRQLSSAGDYTPRPVVHHQPKPPKKLELPPPAAGKYSRVFAYLNKTRGISNTVIAETMKRKLLYEDERHNCVFVGLDENHAPAFATKRSTTTVANYRGDATGSRKEIGFMIDNKTPELFVVEAPIDALAIMTLLQLNNCDPGKYSYLALCGVSDKALRYHIERPENEGIKKIYLATDNDEAGNKARDQLRTSLRSVGYNGSVIDKSPKQKDWDDDLLGLLHPGRGQQTASKPELRAQSDQITFDRSMQI